MNTEQRDTASHSPEAWEAKAMNKKPSYSVCSKHLNREYNCHDCWPDKGIWDERAKAWIMPSGTVKQGRRPMFKPFEESKQ